MINKFKLFTIVLSLKTTRDFHFTMPCNLFYQKLRKITDEKKEIEIKKLVKSSEEVFEMSENKIRTIQTKGELEATAFVKQLIFEEAILTYLNKYGTSRRGHVEFIAECLKKMKIYEVNHNLEMYKKILNIFPEVKMIPKSIWQAELYHYPKQQESAQDILCAMEENGVIPDEDFGRMLFRRFGLHTSPIARYQRMVYWMPKMKNLNPYPVPQFLPKDPSEVARIALTRLNSIRETQVNIHEVMINDNDKTWIASAQSKTQKNLISYLNLSLTGENQERLVYVDGPYTVWVRHEKLNYYLLTSHLDKNRAIYYKQLYENQRVNNKVFYDNWYTVFDPNTEIPVHFGDSSKQKALPAELTIYEDELEGRSILASCIIENDNLSSLRIWVNRVIKENPELNDFRVVFRINLGPGDLIST